MTLRTLLSLAARGWLHLLLRATRIVYPVYRVFFLADAARHGLLRALAGGPQPLDRIAGAMGIAKEQWGPLEAWLQIGVRIGELSLKAGRYGLRGYLARALADPANDPAAAWLEEISTLHRDVFLDLPARLKSGRRLTLADHDGTLVARSSRLLEPFVAEVVRATVPADRPVRLLEIGCGSGVHIREAARRNSRLTAVGLELAPAVAEAARASVLQWGLEDRVAIEAADVRDRMGDGSFDLATLHQNIYYFPVAERTKLLAHVRTFLEPGGTLVLTSGCQGGSVAVEICNLWGAATEGCGPLPRVDELCAQMTEAGYSSVRAWNLVPGDRVYAFTGRNPGNPSPPSPLPGGEGGE